MKKIISITLCLALLALTTCIIPTVSADMVTGKVYTFETENLDASRISYTDGALKDFFDYGNGVSGTYIRVQNTPGKTGNYVAFTLDVPEDGNYRVSYGYRLHTTSGTNQFSINGTDVGDPRDFYDKTYGNENDIVKFTTEPVDLKKGSNTFKVTTTKLATTGEDRITVDYIQLSSTDTTTVGYDNALFVSDFDYFDFDRYAEPDHSDLQFLSAGSFGLDKCSCGKQDIILDGTLYTKGFGLEPTNGTTSVLNMPIPEGAVAFQSVVGLNDHKRGSSYDQKNVVSFYIDGVEVYKTDEITFGYFDTVSIPIPYGAKTLTIKNNCGKNSENDHICFGDARFELGTSNDITLTDFTVDSGKVLVYGSDILILLPENTDLSSLTPTFKISETSSCDIVAGSTSDFSAPKTITVTAQNGHTAAYTVTAFAGNALNNDEKTAVAATEEKINSIHDTVSASDKVRIESAESAFDALSAKAKLFVENYSKLAAARERYDIIKSEPIKVACVGDSITYGGVAAKSYPVRLQETLGDDFKIYNGGVGGTTVSKNGNYPYWTTSSYTLSKQFHPDYVLIMFGTNDAQVANWSNCKDKIEGYYRDLIAEYTALDTHPEIILATPAWYYLDAPSGTSAGSERYHAINTTIVSMVKALAEEYGFPVADVSAATKDHPDWFARDGVHPDDTGYAAIAETFSKILLPKNTAKLSTVSMDGKTIADFSDGTHATYITKDPIHLESLVFDAEGTVKTTVNRQDTVTQITITVTSQTGKYQENYLLTVLPNEELSGDLDGDGARTVSDVVELRRLIMKGNSTDWQLHIGDLDGDSSLTVSDVVELRRLIMKG